MAQAVLDGTTVLGSRQELADSLVGNDPEETEQDRRHGGASWRPRLDDSRPA